MIISPERDGLRRQVEDCIASAYTKGYKRGVADVRGKLSKSAVWSKLSKVYNMKGLPDEAYSVIGDVMLGLVDMTEGEG